MATTSKENNISHVQAKFFTKQSQYAIPDDPFYIPSNVGVSELSTIVNTRLGKGDLEETVSFDFLIDGEFLRVTLEEHMLRKSLSTETLLELEYVERHPAPEPSNFLLHDDWVSAVQAANDYILTGSYDSVVRIWNTEGALIIETSEVTTRHTAAVKCIAWITNDDKSHIKRFVSGSHDETILFWEWNQRTNILECIHSCRGHSRSVDCLSASPNMSLFSSGSWDSMLKIWSTASKDGGEHSDSDSGQRPQKRKKSNDSKTTTQVPVLTLSGHNEGISATVWLDDNCVCTASWDHTIRLWDIQNAKETSCLTGSKTFFDASYSSLNRTLITASADRHIRLYDPRHTGGADVKCTFTSHTAWVTCVSWSPNNENQFISGAYDKILKLWDVRSPKAPLYDMAGHEDRILACDWSMQQYMLSGGADNQLKIFTSTDKNSLGYEP